MATSTTYVVPQVLVFQEFNTIPQANLRQLHAHITGGHAWLVRYSDEQEKEVGNLTWTETDENNYPTVHRYYDPVTTRHYYWPERPAGGVIDHDYTKVFIDNALLQYFADYIGSGSMIKTVPGVQHAVHSESYSFKANGQLYPRTHVFYDRDVQLGDVAYLRAVVDGENYDLWTYVAGFDSDPIDAEIQACESDSGNANDRVAMVPVIAELPTGIHNCLTITEANSTAYDGTADGDLIETYTVRVIRSSAQRQLQTALLQVTSASGNDDDLRVTPAGYGVPTSIGTRGLTITFGSKANGDCSLSADAESVAPVDLVVGQTWTVEVGQAWTETTADSNEGNDYVGDMDGTYVVTCTKGGLWADLPEIAVTTDKGFDMSGSTDVAGAGEAIPVGANGVTITFTGDGLNKGDTFYIPVKAQGHGAIRTLLFGHNFPAAVQDANAGDGDGVEMDLTLFIPRTSIQIPAERRVDTTDALYNWTQTDTQITINEGILAYDSTWTHDGVPQALPVMSDETEGYGKLYVEYRAWRSELCSDVQSIDDMGQLNDYISGALTPDNPLKWGVFKALQNNNGVSVKYTSVCDPSQVENWLDVLELLDGRDDVYGLVPLTKNKLVQDAWQGHVSTQSTPEMARWRVAWFNATSIREKAIINAETGENAAGDPVEVLAVVEDDPLSDDTQFTVVRVTSHNARFVTNHVRAGDIVRANYATDQYGTVTYEEYVVDAVLNEDTLRLMTGPAQAFDLPKKIEIWRNLTAYEQAVAVGQQAGAWNNRRVRMVWPDEIGDGGTMMEGFHLCAALAALSGGVVSHQGLTRLAIEGFDDLSHTVQWFNRTQQNTMAGDGVWIVTQDTTGKVFTRHAVTTGATDDINQREEMVTRNVDAISYYFFDTFDPYIGISNVTPSLIALLRAEVKSAVMFLKSNNYVARLGSQLIDATIAELRPHLILKDRVVIALDLTIPYALNNIEIHLIV